MGWGRGDGLNSRPLDPLGMDLVQETKVCQVERLGEIGKPPL